MIGAVVAMGQIHRIMRNATLFAGLMSLVVGCAGQEQGSATAWYGEQNGVPPKTSKIFICHGFGCNLKTAVRFSPGDIEELRGILAEGEGSASQERIAIAKAVQWQEKRVGPIVGSDKDIGGLDMRNANVPGQMDCIDESTNTTSLLLVAEENGMLTHHRVGRPVARGFLLDGRYPHATASIIEFDTGTAYAVDSWPQANAEKPDVILLSTWMKTWPDYF